MAAPKRLAVILAGGAGTRFWPLSRADRPKQYLRLFGDRSLIQYTFDRLAPLTPDEKVLVCSGESQLSLLREQVPQTEHILEPCARNTGPAVALTTAELLARGHSEDTVVGIFPADHFIGNAQAFAQTLDTAYTTAAETEGLVTLGIVPTSPHTGYGYIESDRATVGQAARAVRFKEKPDAATAQRFVDSGKFFWNAGIFVWRLGSIRAEFRQHASPTYAAIEKAVEQRDLGAIYPALEAQPVDKMILEKSDRVFVIPAEMQWNDVGSWSALTDLMPQSADGNVAVGKALFIDSQRNLVHAQGKQVALIGCEDLIVVADGDKILITRRDQDQKVRQAAEALP